MHFSSGALEKSNQIYGFWVKNTLSTLILMCFSDEATENSSESIKSQKLYNKIIGIIEEMHDIWVDEINCSQVDESISK